MTTGLLLGALLGAAVFTLGWALVPPRPSLAQQVARWELQRTRRPTGQPGRQATGRRGLSGADARVARRDPFVVMASAVLEWTRARGWSFDRLRQDLEIVDRSLEGHMARKIMYALIALVAPGFVATVAALLLSTPVSSIPLLLGLLCAAATFVLVDVNLAQEAARRRRELRRVVASYLDLVSMSLAGSRGIPEALPSAARIGSGWGFELLQDTIDRARYTGITPWSALGDLGERVGLRELQDLGATVTRVIDDGARVRKSLAARAQTERRRQLSEIEGQAKKADDSIVLAQMIMAVGFLLLLGYPAVVAVLTA